MFSEEEVREALEFLNIAKKDFEAAELLLINKYHPQGLFTLQQSIEKISKAILRALGIASIKTLREKVGHRILVKGLKLIASRLDDMLKEMYANTFIRNLRGYVTIFCLCREALDEFERMLEITDESKNLVKQRVKQEYSKISNSVKKISRIALHKADQKIIDELNAFFDSLTNYVQEPWLILKEPKMIEMLDILKSLLVKFDKCLLRIQREIKDREQRARFRIQISESIDRINRDIEECINKIIRAIYLLNTFMFLLAYYVIFEANVSKLRYPSKRWSPLKISDDDIIVIEAKKFIETVKTLKLLISIEEFIKGTIGDERSKAVYTSIIEYLGELKLLR